jgi:hypothetical protein
MHQQNCANAAVSAIRSKLECLRFTLVTDGWGSAHNGRPSFGAKLVAVNIEYLKYLTSNFGLHEKETFGCLRGRSNELHVIMQINCNTTRVCFQLFELFLVLFAKSTVWGCGAMICCSLESELLELNDVNELFFWKS